MHKYLRLTNRPEHIARKWFVQMPGSNCVSPTDQNALPANGLYKYLAANCVSPTDQNTLPGSDLYSRNEPAQCPENHVHFQLILGVHI